MPAITQRTQLGQDDGDRRQQPVRDPTSAGPQPKLPQRARAPPVGRKRDTIIVSSALLTAMRALSSDRRVGDRWVTPVTENTSADPTRARRRVVSNASSKDSLGVPSDIDCRWRTRTRRA